MKRLWIYLFSFLLLPAASPASENIRAQFGKLKITARDLCIETALVKNGKPAATIVGDEKLAQILVDAIKGKTGVPLPVAAADPGKGNVITIGNRDRNDFVSSLYNYHYTLLDAKYPGKGGHEVRSLHNPFGDKRNFILCGGSTAAGDRTAVEKLAAKIKALPNGKNLTLGYLADVKLDPSYKVPADSKDAKLWEESIIRKNSGFFGWNSLSKNLALFYVTGNKHYADEFLRLAFPKDKATEKELFQRDGEAYKDDFSDPICSVYHYCGIMMILYWDLVEESPVWTEADRKKVNEAFYRQLHYTLTKKAYTNPYRYADKPVKTVVERHRDWEGTSLYAVARYFNKYFPCPEAGEALRLVRNFMEPRYQEVCYGTINRATAHSNMAPAFLYASLTGDRKYINNPALKGYARALLILCHWNNRPDKPDRDPNFNMSSLYSLMHIAYMVQDNAFFRIAQNLPIDKECFRLGQSYYPARPYPRDSAEEANGRWEAIRSADWLIKPAPSFPLKDAYNSMSYHDTTDDTGDYWLYDTSYAQGLREIARVLSIARLRIDGVTVLNGLGNTMRFYADGASVNPQPYHARMLDFGTAGPFVYAEAFVPSYDDFNWKRTAVLRKRKYMILADEVTPVRDLKTGEFYNDFFRPWRASVWRARPGTNEFILDASPDGRIRKYLFSTSLDAKLYTVPLNKINIPLNMRMFSMKTDWKKGETLRFVTIIRIGDADTVPSTAQEGDSVALAVPEPALFRWTANGMELVTSDGKLAAENSQWRFTSGGTVPEKQIRQMLANRKLPQPDAGELPAPPAPAKFSVFDMQIQNAQAITVDGKPWTILTGNNVLTLINENLQTVLRKTLDANIGSIAYQTSKGLILAGCKDENLIALDRQGKEIWRFTSQMHPQLYKFGPYWHKSAYPGIRSLLVASWPDNREQIFIGSAGTLEILDADGKFIDRKYLQFGPVSSLYMQKTPARLWALRRLGGRPSSFTLTANLEVANPDMVWDAQKTYMGGFGFSSVGKRFLIPRGDKLYGDFCGAHNRIMLWDQQGKPLAHANLGAAGAASAGNFGETNCDTDLLRFLDVLPDGSVTALTSRERVYFWTPDLKLINMLILPGIPRCGATDGKAVYAGLHNGLIVKVLPDGSQTTVGKLPGPVQVLHCRNGEILAGDTAGNVAIW